MGFLGFEATLPREALSAVLTQGVEGRGPSPRLPRDCRELARASSAERGPGKPSCAHPHPRELGKVLPEAGLTHGTQHHSRQKSSPILSAPLLRCPPHLHSHPRSASLARPAGPAARLTGPRLPGNVPLRA